MVSQFSKYHLLQALSDAGLPSSYTTLVRLERKGIIPPPKNPMFYPKSGRTWRQYTKGEIDTIVQIMRKYSAMMHEKRG